MQTNTKKRKLIPNVTSGGARLSVAGLRQLAQSEPQAFHARISALINEGRFSLSDVRDIQSLFHALADVQVPAHVEFAGSERAIMASAFPLLVGGLTVSAINAAYESVPTIGQELVTEIEDNKKVTTIAAIHSLDKDIDQVNDGDPFPEIGASEEKAEIRSKRNGRTLSVMTEAIEENNVADIVQRCNALGEIAADWVEEQTLDRVTDRTGSNTSSAAAPYVYRPNGTGTALYSSTANTPGTRAPSGTRVVNNGLVDEEDLENARTILAAMKNNRGKRIAIPMSECLLMVPDALVGVASKILNSELVPGVENELNNWGPRGRYRPTLLSSPKLDDISTTAWYLGIPRRQFMRKWKLRFEYVTLSGDIQKFLETRLAFQARIAWDVEIGATDYVYFVQNLQGTTYTP